MCNRSIKHFKVGKEDTPYTVNHQQRNRLGYYKAWTRKNWPHIKYQKQVGFGKMNPTRSWSTTLLQGTVCSGTGKWTSKIRISEQIILDSRNHNDWSEKVLSLSKNSRQMEQAAWRNQTGSKQGGLQKERLENSNFYVPETDIMYRTLHIAVDFLNSLKIAVVWGGVGCYWDIVHILYPCRWWQRSSTGI